MVRSRFCKDVAKVIGRLLDGSLFAMWFEGAEIENVSLS